MFKDLKPYPAYRDSGIDWLPKVPANWDVRRMRYVVSEIDRRSIDGDEQLLRVSQYTGITERHTSSLAGGTDTRAESLVGYKQVSPRDLVINIMLAWNGSLGVSQFRGIVSPAYCVYRFDAGVVPLYFHQLLRSPLYKARIKTLSTGIVESRLRLYSERFFGLEGLLPSPGEQAAIVKYLAHTDARIDRAIAAKRKMIALLDEQKQAIVNQAITRGLEPLGLLEDCDAEGSASWPRARLKDVASVQTGLTLGKRYGDTPVTDFSYLRVANVQTAGLDLRNVTSVSVPQIEADRCTLRVMDVLMTEGGDIDKLGRATIWRGEIETCLHQNHVFAVRCGYALNPDYLVSLLTTPIARRYFYVTAKKTTNLASTNSTTLREFAFPLPSRREQVAIVGYIQHESRRIDGLRERLSRGIELLREFRARLVADIVTGRVDVRAAGARLPGVEAIGIPSRAPESDEDGSDGLAAEVLEDVDA